MKIDVAGRIRNVSLPKSRPLLPLYEAIVNSIQAIEDAKVATGQITIRLFRDSLPKMFDTDKTTRDITGFAVEDNGIGFTPENFEAFQTSDTTFKADRGGKGIGRFMWLVAFDAVAVTSTVKVDGKWMTRTFDFVPKGTGVANEKFNESKASERKTIVRLKGFKDKYREAAPKKIETLGTHIAEHCLEYLIRPNPPQIDLIDEANDLRLDLNELFEREMKANAKPSKYRVGTSTFEMLHVRLYTTHIDEHLVHYCANHRSVKTEKLAGRVPNLAKRLRDEDGKEFVYASYVDSPLLDETVNEERTDFNLTSLEGEMFPTPITWKQVRESAVNQANSYLAAYTEPIKRDKERRIDTFVATQAPMYAPILKYVEEAVGLIDVDADDDALDLELYKAYHKLQVDLKIEGQTLLAVSSASQNEFEKYAEEFEDYLEKVSETNKADLARYVFHRRLVLDFLHKLLGQQDDGTYAMEDRVHQLIFPMGTTSRDVLPEQHNLWLVDERMAYHRFLASDKQLRTLPPLVNTSAKEPDIIVFDKACAFVSEVNEPFQTITIVEFKRPRRTTYSGSENPIQQIRDYIQKIRSGKARTPSGHEVAVTPQVRFYCYVVADKADRLEDIAFGSQLDPTPDGQGYFGYLKHENAYIEIVTYRQLHTNAQQRNAVFFDKLGLPSVLPRTDTVATT